MGTLSFESLCLALERDDPSLSIVNLNSRHIGNRGAKLLAQALRSNRHAVVLFLDNCELSASGVKALVDSLSEHPKLEFLYLSFNPELGDEGAQHVARLLPRLQVCKIADCNVGPQGASYLGHSLKNCRRLETLGLDGNRVGDLGAGRIADGLAYECARLRCLDLRYNGIQDVSSIQESFCECLTRNKSLSKLLLQEDNDENHSDTCIELETLLELNRIGRRYFVDLHDPRLWPRIVERASQSSDRVAFRLLHHRPDLVDT